MSFKVVVIDDKPLIRQSIISTIDWDTLDCEIIGEAENGIDGKNLILSEKPDIIITDIKMPGHNGLELSEYVKPIIPHAKIILITGYQEFELAQKAISLGVYELLLKPLSNEDIKRVIRSAVNDLRESRESLEELRKKFVLDLINGSFAGSVEKFEDSAKKLEFNCNRFCITAIRFNNTDTRTVNRLFTFIEDASVSIEKNFGVSIVKVGVDKNNVLFILFKDATSVRESRRIIKELYALVYDSLQKNISADYLVASSSLYNDLQQGAEAYSEVLRILDTNFFKTNEKLLYADNYAYLKAFEKFYIFDDLQEFYGIMERADNEEIARELDYLIEKINVYSKGDIFVAKGLLAEVCITVSRHFYRIYGNKDCRLKDINEILSDINKLANINDAEKYINDYINDIRLNAADIAGNSNPVVRKVVEYIKKSYSGDISLEKLGEKFNINTSYLSRLLKRETGKNFVDILSGVRIDAAKWFLKEPDSKVAEVAEQVGYKDYTYFYQVFRRIEGISPAEYKKSSQKN